MPSGKLLALVRIDGNDDELLGNAGRLRTKVCWASPPFADFDCSRELDGVRLDGPVAFFHGARLFVIARKHFIEPRDRKRTALYELTGDLDGGDARDHEHGELPSAGDTSYAGVAPHRRATASWSPGTRARIADDPVGPRACSARPTSGKPRSTCRSFDPRCRRVRSMMRRAHRPRARASVCRGPRHAGRGLRRARRSPGRAVRRRTARSPSSTTLSTTASWSRELAATRPPATFVGYLERCHPGDLALARRPRAAAIATAIAELLERAHRARSTRPAGGSPARAIPPTTCGRSCARSCSSPSPASSPRSPITPARASSTTGCGSPRSACSSISASARTARARRRPTTTTSSRCPTRATSRST